MYPPSEELYECLWEFCNLFYSESERKEDDKSMSNPNNKAPKEMEGSYVVTIKGNKITLTDKDFNVGIAKCRPGDEFDLGIGIKEALKKIEEAKKVINVGNKVEVVNPGKSYIRYTDWLKKNLKFEDAVRYDYGCCPNEGTNGIVIAIAKHTKEDNILVAFKTDNHKVYLVEDKGLRKVSGGKQ